MWAKIENGMKIVTCTVCINITRDVKKEVCMVIQSWNWEVIYKTKMPVSRHRYHFQYRAVHVTSWRRDIQKTISRWPRLPNLVLDANRAIMHASCLFSSITAASTLVEQIKQLQLHQTVTVMQICIKILWFLAWGHPGAVLLSRHTEITLVKIKRIFFSNKQKLILSYKLLGYCFVLVVPFTLSNICVVVTNYLASQTRDPGIRQETPGSIPTSTKKMHDIYGAIDVFMCWQFKLWKDTFATSDTPVKRVGC